MGLDWLCAQIIFASAWRRDWGYHWRLEQFFPPEWSM